MHGNISRMLWSTLTDFKKKKMRTQHSVDSQQLTVEDSDDTRALQAVGGSAALTFLEGCWQLLDLVPLTDVLQEKRRTFTHFGKIANIFF